MRRRPAVIATTGIVILAIASIFAWVQQPTEEFFVVDVNGERFVIKVTDAETIRLALENLDGKNNMHPAGELARGDGGFNQPWSWHLKPDSVRMVEVSMELCDGMPSHVEEELDYWLDTVERYCPWSGRIVAIGKESGVAPPAKEP